MQQPAEADLESLLAGGLATCNGGPSAAVWSPSFLSLSTTVPARQFDVVLPTSAGDAPLAVGADRSRHTAVDNGDGTATYWVLSASAGLLRLTHRVGPLAQYVFDHGEDWKSDMALTDEHVVDPRLHSPQNGRGVNGAIQGMLARKCILNALG